MLEGYRVLCSSAAAKKKLLVLLGGMSAGKELPSDCGSPRSQTCAQASKQRGDVSHLKSTAKVFSDAHANCWACFTLPYPCLTLPSSTTISNMFHMKPTRLKRFLCSPVTDVKSAPVFTNLASTLTLLARSSQVNQQSQRASLEAEAVGRHRTLPPHVRLRRTLGE